MAPVAQKSAPKPPEARPVSNEAANEFSALKRQLSEISSWEVSPDSWDRMQIIYPVPGEEKQAKSFLSVIAIGTEF